MFDRLAGADKEIDAEELQDMLTISLTQSKSSRTVEPLIKDTLNNRHLSLIFLGANCSLSYTDCKCTFTPKKDNLALYN